MKIVGICGSPREKATDHILKEALRMLEERGFATTSFTVRGKRISPCLHCDLCLTNNGVRLIRGVMYSALCPSA